MLKFKAGSRTLPRDLTRPNLAKMADRVTHFHFRLCCVVFYSLMLLLLLLQDNLSLHYYKMVLETSCICVSVLSEHACLMFLQHP